MKPSEHSRRGLLALAIIWPAMADAARAAEVAPACTTTLPPAQQSMRSALGYKEPSDDRTRVCGGCAFFSTTAQPPLCGKCQLLNGQVSAGARCNSWAAKR